MSNEPTKKIEVVVREVDVAKLEAGGAYIIQVQESDWDGGDLAALAKWLDGQNINFFLAVGYTNDPIRFYNVPAQPTSHPNKGDK